MANGGVDLDELLAARERLNKTKERGKHDIAALEEPELSITVLLGLWALLTVLIFVRVVVAVINFLVDVADKAAADRRRR